MLRQLVFAAMVIAAAPVAAEPLTLTIVAAPAGADAATGMPVVTLKMSAESAKVFADFTGKNVGRRVALMVDGEAVSAPVIREPILGDAIQISGSIAGVDEAKALAARLAAGSARVSVDLLAE